MKAESVEVRCYSGYKAEELPRSFVWRGKEHLIEEIRESRKVQSTRPGRGRKTVFCVMTSTGQVFELSYHEQDDKWSLEKEVK